MNQTEAYLKMMAAWLDASKACAQISTAALFLPIFFNRQILGIQAEVGLAGTISKWHIACWLSLSMSIALAMSYQFTVARLMQSALTSTSSGLLFPRVQFWGMAIFLLLGIALFVRGAALN